MEIETVISEFIGNQKYTYSEINNGLINKTYLVDSEQGKYILQCINTGIFKNPEAILHNHLKVNQVLKNEGYPRNILEIVPTQKGDYLLKDQENGSWRMTGFIENSVTFLKVPNPETAFEAAQCFSEFYALLNKNALQLEDTLPGFINFEKRISDYKTALSQADVHRKEKSKSEIDFVNEWMDLPEKWIRLDKEGILPKRAIHADPKISNILFNTENQAIAVIDLDTMMTSTLLYDFGDMIRSYTNLTNEDDAQQIENYSPEIYQAVREGFLTHLKNILTPIEIENLDYAAQVVIFIQAVRFLTDYLNGDVYYAVKHENHNLDRTKNQIHLLKNIIKSVS